MALTVEQQLTKAHIWLMGEMRYIAMSGVIMAGKNEVTDVATACTDGLNKYYGRQYFAGCDIRVQRAVVLHENWHVALRQLSVWENLWEENPKLANIAADYVVNILIHDSDPAGKEVKCGAKWFLDARFRGMDTGAVYRLLKKDMQEGGGSADMRLADGSTVRVTSSAEDPVPSEHSPDSHDTEARKGLSEKERQSVDERIDQALRQGAAHAARMNADVDRAITQILTPRVRWEDALREWVSSTVGEPEETTWRRPSRRWISQDMYMPSSYSERVGRLCIANDTSGSIDASLFDAFMAETMGIVTKTPPEAIDLLYWGSSVVGHERYTPEQYPSLLSTTRPRGGGGTRPQVIVDYLNAQRIKPVGVVVLTDGEVAGWGTGWPCPVLWAVVGSDVVAPVGKTIHIK